MIWLLLSHDTLSVVQTWATVVGSTAAAILVVLAVWAGRRVGRQIGQADEHHDELLRLSIRPALSVRAATFVSDGVDVAIENIGAGPALRIALLGWPVAMGTNRPTLDEATDALSDLKASQNPDRPQLAAEFAGIPAGQPPRRESMHVVEPAVIRAAENVGYGLLLWEASGTDIFEKATEAAGWCMITPDGVGGAADAR